jgi:DNA invertase Pin-like site-specific DNA recombinase
MSYQVAALYCRLSPRPDDDYGGVDEQARQGREYAARAWPGVPVEVFPERGISAANGDERPELDRLLQWLEDGRVAHVWAVEQSRLSRETDGRYPWFALAARLDAARVTEVHTKRDGIVRVTDDVAGIKAVIAAGEVRRLKERVNDTLAARAAAGVPAGVQPFGYKAVGVREARTYEIIAEEAEAIRWAAGKALDGWSLSRIADVLDGQGLRGKLGGKLTPVAVRRWLVSPSIAGHRVHHGTDLGPGSGKWEPILDEQTWLEVNAVLAQPRIVRRIDGGTYPVGPAHLSAVTGRVSTNGGVAGRRYLLTGGLAVCGVCGHAMIGQVKQLGKKPGLPPKRTAPYLLCHPSRGGRACTGIMLDPAEELVLARLFGELEQRPAFAAAMSADQHADTRRELAGALAAVQAERVQYARDAAAGEMTRAEWLAMRPVFDEREGRLRHELAAVPAPTGHADWAEVRQAWPELTLDEQRAFLRRYIASVTVSRARPGTRRFDPGRVSIEWKEV